MNTREINQNHGDGDGGNDGRGGGRIMRDEG